MLCLIRRWLPSPGGRGLAHVPGAGGTAALPLHGRREPGGSILLVLRPGSRTEQESHAATTGGKTFQRNTAQSGRRR
jgi:hypothetical protein